MGPTPPDEPTSVAQPPPASSPPPPPPPPAAPGLPPPTQAEPSFPIAPTAVRPATITGGWRWVLAGGWLAVMAGIGTIANTAFQLGNPPFWLGWIVIPFALPVAVEVALVVDWRWTLELSLVAVLGTIAIALIDLGSARAAGLGELAFAVVGLLITLAAYAGKVPRRRTAGERLH